MKKIFQFILLAVIIVIPLVIPGVSSAQTTSATTGTCTGEIRTDMLAAQDCVNRAIVQGEALGYEMSCRVEQLGLAGFIDPTSGRDYILNGVCTVNDSTGHGAYLLAGFTAAPGSTAIIQSINPGWSILRTELAYEGAFNQCGGRAPYYINGAYTCTAPVGTPPTTSPTGSTRTSSNTLSTEAAVQEVYRSIFRVNSSLVQNILARYDGYSRTMLSPGTLTATTPVSSNNSQCYIFTQTLQNNSVSDEVFALSYALRHEGFLTQTTRVFDTTVMTAVKRFQEAHSTEILDILGLTQGTGVVGARTRAYLNSNCIVPASVLTTAPITPTPSPVCTLPSATSQRTGVYAYTFTKNSNGTYTISLNNRAYGTAIDSYFVQANYSFTAPNALDLNRQNQGKFNYLQALPGTAAGNTEYANLFGSFNNAYYDWDVMVNRLSTSTCTTNLPPTTVPVQTQSMTLGTRYIKVSVSDWVTLPIMLREITVYGPNNTVIRPTVISATSFDIVGYQPPTNLIDGNENTVWRAAISTAGTDLQVITLDLGQVYAVSRIAVTNYGLTDTRVFVIEVSQNGNSYIQIAEVRAQANTPIADKAMVYGMIQAATTVGPLPHPLPSPVITNITPLSGTTGTRVTISGTYFTATDNKVKFGNFGNENNPINNLPSNDGKIIFEIPTTNYFSCWASRPACAVAASLVQPGTYPISVINSNGTSNSSNFTVISNCNPPISCSLPPVGMSYVGGTSCGCGTLINDN